jgi:leucyl/phenylalanyl-tRNA---protein transferase
MPLFSLSEKLLFPPPWLAHPDGLLCIGGDLSVQRILLAYENGIFPWFAENEPILWWSPDPRLVLFPGNIKISKSLRKTIRKKEFEITVDQAFEETIRSCAKPRKKRDTGTWLVEKMIEAYIRLHKSGFAHSVETWKDGRLVGGLYGISLGGVFFGESMFAFQNNASKVALTALTCHLTQYNYDLIDCQVKTDHLISMGAAEIPRKIFLNIISHSVKRTDIGNIWNDGFLVVGQSG